jgi:penicillin-binding protein 1A
VISVKVAQQIGLDTLLSYLSRFKIERAFPRNLSIALGSSEVTLLELVRSYTAFANGGDLVRPIFILKITDAEGNILDEVFPEKEEILSPETAFQMVSMLREVVRRGTGRRAQALHRPVGGKTGTTNDQIDAWFVGFTPDLVSGVWVGYDEKEGLGKRETGGRAALPIWLDFMQTVLEGVPVSDFPVPPGIVFVNVDSKTGLRASPGSGDTVLEAFRRGTEPQRFVRRSGEREGRDFFQGDF